jgi:hypothetical protein
MQRKSKLPFSYNISIESKEESVLVDWGNTPGWMEACRDRLDSAYRISLIPKVAGSAPVVSAILDGEKRWLIGSRVCGKINKGTGDGKELRIYFIGWQQTVNGLNVKSIHWVYPGGAVECSDEPTLVDRFFELGE